MSNVKAPKLHQSTAFPCPVLIRISGAMYLKIFISIDFNIFLILTLWCHKMCGSSGHPRSPLCTDQSQSASHDLHKRKGNINLEKNLKIDLLRPIEYSPASDRDK